MARVQRRIGILEDHLHVLAVGRQSVPVQLGGVFAAQQDPAGRRGKQAHQRAGQCGFPAAGFAAQPEGFAGGELERHAVHRGACAMGRRVLHAQVFDLQQGRRADGNGVVGGNRHAVRGHKAEHRASRGGWGAASRRSDAPSRPRV
ncbi:hypothetical protein G6F46_014069 [Rhizopus delemar]|nr:hypothetical protein G6F46_014069 [Rhizopus delemar]